MVAELPAHVLRLEHAPIARAQRQIAVVTPAGEPSFVRVLLGLDPCRACGGARVHPRTGEPCASCTLVPR